MRLRNSNTNPNITSTVLAQGCGGASIRLRDRTVIRNLRHAQVEGGGPTGEGGGSAGRSACPGWVDGSGCKYAWIDGRRRRGDGERAWENESGIGKWQQQRQRDRVDGMRRAGAEEGAGSSG